MRIQKLVFYAGVAVILVAGQFFVTRNLATGMAPPIAAQTLDGETVADKIGSSPVLIYFWAEWCGICKAMQDAISSVLHDYSGVTVALQSGDGEAVHAYMHAHGLAWPAIADPAGKIAARYGVTGVPAVFIVDKRGQIRFSSIGFSSETGIRLRLWWVGL
ncbi:MAG: protein disulfide oxidoreductase [Gammaproteobacteria bacterium]